VQALAAAAREFSARQVVIADASLWQPLKEALAGTGIACGAGEAAVLEAASRPVDVSVAAIVGAAGLAPTMAAIRASKVLALANKEALVCAGSLLLKAARKENCIILPVDSEHSAIFQLFNTRQRGALSHIAITASGGPFRTTSAEQLAYITVEQAVQHPVWSMGQKISVDSATLMNKGLEVIEACHLFDLPEQDVQVLVHPQSIVHGMVYYQDGSVLAQMATPDMMTPLAHALAWPERMATPLPALDLLKIGTLSFTPVDNQRFPCLELAREAWRRGGDAPTVLNAANEVAVGAFLQKHISFLDIPRVVETTLATLPVTPVSSLGDVFMADSDARRTAGTECKALQRESA
jgi:1-deoxy-D-xylulose-5-phosphate reductoisomerase